MGRFSSKKTTQANAQRAENMEWEASNEDRRAKQNFLWARSEAAEGRSGHSRIWAEQGQANVAEADRLRREAAQLRRK